MMRFPLLVALCFAASWASPAAAQAPTASPDSLPPTVPSGTLGAYETAYHQLDALNEGLERSDANRQTPQATLEHFVTSARDNDYGRAALALNLNLIPADQQAEQGPALAYMLYYLLDRHLSIGWDGLPDRPDGLRSGPARPNDPLAGQPRRSLLLGSLALDERDAAIRLQRVRVGEAAPVWVFSPQTVENVMALYDRYGPGPIARHMPDWAKVQAFDQTPLWKWLAFFLLFAASVVIAIFARRWARRGIRRIDETWAEGLSRVIATPLAVAVGLFVLYLSSQILLDLRGSVSGVLGTVVLLLWVGALTWLAMRTVTYISEYIVRENVSDLAGDSESDERRYLTYVSVARRAIVFVVFVIGVGIVIAHFQTLQALGISLLASAGVATVILGIAAQPVLGNLVAGIQIALTQPVKIGDSVLFEGQWGYIEDVTYTYLIIRTWDERRVVVPLRYFITRPVENWSMKDSHMIKPIYVRADYRTDVGRVREKFGELVRGNDKWDGEDDPTVQVTDVGDETIEIRALCSAKDPSDAWDLHCEMREALVAFIAELERGQFLPRRRLEVAQLPGGTPDEPSGDGAPDVSVGDRSAPA